VHLNAFPYCNIWLCSPYSLPHRSCHGGDDDLMLAAARDRLSRQVGSVSPVIPDLLPAVIGGDSEGSRFFSPWPGSQILHMPRQAAERSLAKRGFGTVPRISACRSCSSGGAGPERCHGRATPGTVHQRRQTSPAWPPRESMHRHGVKSMTRSGRKPLILSWTSLAQPHCPHSVPKTPGQLDRKMEIPRKALLFRGLNGAQGRNRTTDTAIFRPAGRKIKMLMRSGNGALYMGIIQKTPQAIA